MTGLGWTRNGEMVALGWTLLHFCWQGTALALLYAMADRATRHSPMKVRYGLAMLLLTLMPLAAFATFIEQARLVVALPPGDFTAGTFASELGAFHGTLVQGIPSAAPVMESGEIWIASHADQLLPWVDSIWLSGVALLALRALGGWWSLEGVRRRAVRTMPVEVQASFYRVSRKLRMGREVVLRVSDEVISPLAMGVWRTAVILPASALMRLDQEQLEAVLAHELAHVRRWDYVCNLAQTGIECLLFFHPAVWWVSRRTRDLREVCCDEVAARSCADPVVYAEALLQLEEGRMMPMAMALHGQNGTLLTRVKKILGEGITMESKTVSGMRVAVAGAVLMGLLVAPKMAKGIEGLPKMTNLAASVPELRAAVQVAPAAAVAESRGEESAEVSVATPVPAAAPAPAPAPMAAPSPAPAPSPMPAPSIADGQDEVKTSGVDYIDGMKKAGYAVDLNRDLDQLISLRSVGVTPEYAKAMAQVGMGTPSLHELVSLKSVGVTPEYLAGLHGSGVAPQSFHEAIGEKSLGITPEYAKGIAALGIGTPTVHDLMGLKAQGVTPEYVASMKAAGIPLTSLHEITSMKALGVTPEYARGIESAGFGKLAAHELVSLKAQGVTPEYVKWVKTTFPEVDVHQIQRAAIFHIDDAYIAKAKGHGFNDLTLDKLVKLKTTGLLD